MARLLINFFQGDPEELKNYILFKNKAGMNAIGIATALQGSVAEMSALEKELQLYVR
jgi:hypothetical protein